MIGRGIGFNLPANLKAVHVWKVDVERDQIGKFSRAGQCLRAGSGFDNLVTGIAQRTDKRIAQRLIVVDRKNFDRTVTGRVGADGLPSGRFLSLNRIRHGPPLSPEG